MAKKKTGKPVGRPSTYKPEYCQALVEHMSQGYSFETFASLVHVTRDCLYKWEKQFPEFLYAKKVGQAKSQEWWERAGIAGMHSQHFKPAMWIFVMKCRFGWRDGSEAPKDEVKKEDITYKAKWGQTTEGSGNGNENT